MQIRDFKEFDLEKLCEFKLKSAEMSFPGHEINLDIFKKHILKSDPETIKVVEVDNIIVGYIRFSVKNTIRGRQGRIDHVFIEKEYRGKGLASKLMRLAEEYFKNVGVDMIRIVVTKGNKPSMDMCKKLGYQTKRLIMEKKL